jgi:hypothetical protein
VGRGNRGWRTGRTLKILDSSYPPSSSQVSLLGAFMTTAKQSSLGIPCSLVRANILLSNCTQLPILSRAAEVKRASTLRRCSAGGRPSPASACCRTSSNCSTFTLLTLKQPTAGLDDVSLGQNRKGAMNKRMNPCLASGLCSHFEADFLGDITKMKLLSLA